MTTQSTGIKFNKFYDLIGEYKSQMACFSATTETLTIRWQYMEKEGKDMNVYHQNRPITYNEYIKIVLYASSNFPEHIYGMIEAQLWIIQTS